MTFGTKNDLWHACGLWPCAYNSITPGMIFSITVRPWERFYTAVPQTFLWLGWQWWKKGLWFVSLLFLIIYLSPLTPVVLQLHQTDWSVIRKPTLKSGPAVKKQHFPLVLLRRPGMDHGIAAAVVVASQQNSPLFYFYLDSTLETSVCSWHWFNCVIFTVCVRGCQPCLLLIYTTSFEDIWRDLITISLPSSASHKRSFYVNYVRFPTAQPCQVSVQRRWDWCE